MVCPKRPWPFLSASRLLLLTMVSPRCLDLPRDFGGAWGASRVRAGFPAAAHSPASPGPLPAPTPPCSPHRTRPGPGSFSIKCHLNMSPVHLAGVWETETVRMGSTCHPHLKVNMLSLKYYLYRKSRSWILEILIN